jgi:serine/threonine protein kinase
MPPEVATLEHDRVGIRSDIFGLGAVLYFLLTGRPPFAGGIRDEVWDRAQRGELDAGALREAGVLRRLEQVCLKAPAADLDHRHATAEELGHALNASIRRPARLAVVTASLTGAAIIAWAAPRAVGDPARGRRSRSSAATRWTFNTFFLTRIVEAQSTW